MKKISTLIATSFVAFSLMSCATTLVVERTQPSELDLSYAKTVAILPMELDSSSQYMQEQKSLASKFINQLKDYAQKDPKFTLVDDETIQNSLKKGFGVPADILIKPEFSSFRVTDSGATIESKDDNGNKIILRDAWKRIVAGDLDISVTDSNTKAVIGTKHFDWFKGNNEDLPKASLVNPETYLNEDIGSYAYLTALMIFDTTVHHPIQLKDSKDKTLKDMMQKGKDLAKAKEYDAAQKHYASIYTSTKDTAAGFNSAIMLQILGKYTDAINLFQSLYDQTADKSILKAIEDARKEKENQDILDKRHSH